MGTSVSIMSGYNAAKKRVDETNSRRQKERAEKLAAAEAYTKARQDEDFLRAENSLKEAEIERKEKIFEAEKTDLLAQKLASNKARLAAAGIADTSGSLKAVQNTLAKKAADEIRNNAYFADLDIRKLDLANSKAAAKALAAITNMGAQDASLVLANAKGKQIHTIVRR